MPDIIKGIKRKTPISGGGAYLDYSGGTGGGSRTVSQTPVKTPSRSMEKAAGKVPALSRDALGSSNDYQIGRLQGVRSSGSSGASKSTGASGGIGGKIAGAVKDVASRASSAAASTPSAVQEEIKRRVSDAAQNAGKRTTGNGSSAAYAPSVPATSPAASTPSAADGGTGGGSSGGNGGTAKGETTGTEVPEAMSYEDYYKRIGGDVYESELQKAIAARVQQAADAYDRQKAQAGTSYEDAARQAYISSMMSQRNLDQQLAVDGIYGGMADSQRIAMDASYQNEVADLERQYIETLADLDQAITDARLAGDTQAAEQMAGYKSTVQSQYANYLLQKDQEAANAAQWQREYEAQLELQRQQAAAQAAADSAAYSGGGYSGGSYSSGGYSGSGYDNGGLSASQVAEMQRALGVSADGLWGPQSSAAAGGMTAAQAWQAYQEATQSSSQSGYSYGGANVNRMSRM